MLRLLIYLILSLGVAFLLVNCKSKEAMEEDPVTSTMVTINEAFEGLKYKCRPNKAADLKLCVSESDEEGNPMIKIYAIYDMEEKMIYGLKRVHGKVRWHDDNSIEVREFPRVRGPEPNQADVKKEIISIR